MFVAVLAQKGLFLKFGDSFKHKCLREKGSKNQSKLSERAGTKFKSPEQEEKNDSVCSVLEPECADRCHLDALIGQSETLISPVCHLLFTKLPSSL